MDVIDSSFRVRGTDGLRVVDASVFTKIPGNFTAVQTYMVAEKAADVILEQRSQEQENVLEVIGEHDGAVFQLCRYFTDHHSTYE